MNNHSIPKSPELERETLAILIQNPGEGLHRKLQEEFFTHPNNLFFSVISALNTRASIATVTDELEKSGLLNGGLAKSVTDLFRLEILPKELFDHNVERLRDFAFRRKGISTASEIEKDACNMQREFRLDEKVKLLLANDGISPFAEILANSAMNGDEFLAKKFPPRPLLVGDWFCEGDLGFVFAPRGVGKTWFAHMLIAALTAGKDLGPWPVPNRAHVCLLDGEMPPDAVQERLQKLEVDGAMLTIHSHQFLFDLCGRSFQLGDAEQRNALLDYCGENGIQVLVIDNLSSVSNVSENDNDEWMELGDWLLDFRRKGISVIVVHHAGRNGNMRGASRREDPAFWIVRLDDSKERTSTEEGARFVSTFTKSRNSRHWPSPMDWHVTEDENETFLINHEAAGTDELVYQCIRDGLDRCSDIASELDISKGTVSKAANKLESNGKISITGRGNQSKYCAN
jgi:putative DNA primase/helicase